MNIEKDNPQYAQAQAFEVLKESLVVSVNLNVSLQNSNKELEEKISALTVTAWQRTVDSMFIVGLSWGYLPIPYLFGAEYENNKAFDCSAFTQKLFGFHGIKLLRTTYQQVTQGTEVAKQDIQPGDLVFFKFKTTGDKPVDHVGIADGKGNMLHTNDPSKPIRIVPIPTNGYVTARRVRV